MYRQGCGATPSVTQLEIMPKPGEERNAFMIPGIGDFGDRFFGTVPAAHVQGSGLIDIVGAWKLITKKGNPAHEY
ncbi:hypothetical protein ABTZ98_27190, partial [Streptomyces bacillaris]